MACVLTKLTLNHLSRYLHCVRHRKRCTITGSRPIRPKELASVTLGAVLDPLGELDRGESRLAPVLRRHCHHLQREAIGLSTLLGTVPVGDCLAHVRNSSRLQNRAPVRRRQLLPPSRPPSTCNQREIYQSPTCIYKTDSIYRYPALVEPSHVSTPESSVSTGSESPNRPTDPGTGVDHLYLQAICRQLIWNLIPL